MDKRVIFPTNSPSSKERDTFFVKEDRSYLTKHAGSYHPEIQKYIENAKPIKDLVQVLLTALGAYEYWGQNVNGDRFKRVPLSNPGEDYGYKTFVSNANYFNHHVNKDPALAKGKVLASIWNDKSKRVELVVGIDVNKDPEAINEIADGSSLAFSMGCRTPYDVCSICGNKAKNRGEYCDHLKYMMNQIDPKSGELVGADNPFPKFFDISRVLIPADKTAYMWTKIAGAANPFHGVPSAFVAEAVDAGGDFMKKIASYKEEHTLKSASVGKKADITKRIDLSPQTTRVIEQAIPTAVRMSEGLAPSLPKAAIDKLAELPLEQVLSTFAGLGMMPTKPEFDRLVIRFVITNKDKMYADFESMDNMVGELIHPDHFNDSVAEAIMPMAEDRSMLKPFLLSRLIKIKQMLDAKDPGAVKVAQSVRELTVDNEKPKNPPITPGAVAGLIAVMYALATQHGTSGAVGEIGSFVKAHPFLAIALGAAAARGMQAASVKGTTGIYDVDDPNRSFYNNDWQSRFARMQARPVTVIKTAASKVDKSLAYKVLGAPVALYGISKAMQAKNEADPQNAGPVSKVFEKHPKALYAGLIMDHLMHGPIRSKIASALESASRVIKTASIKNAEFLDMLPEGDRAIVTDLLILNLAKEINESVLGGT